MLNFQDWMAFSQAVAAVSTLLATVVVATVAQSFAKRSTDIQERFARQSAELQIDREISGHLMRVNFEIYANPELAEFYRRTRYPSEDADYLRLLAQTRFRLAILYQIWRSDRAGLFEGAMQRYGFYDLVGLLVRTSKDALTQACKADGYDQEFIAAVENAGKEHGWTTPSKA